MEVERVQDGPLKNSEITRFLEASKTSYKAVDNILTEKKEPMFQQRTLLEIASETQSRNDDSNPKQTKEPNDISESEPEKDNEISQEIDAATVEEEKEALRVSEEKKKEEERIAQEEKEKEIFERGFAEGKASSDQEAKNSLENGLLALENARKSILDLNASHFINLREQIAEKILKLSSERLGLEIDRLPEQFFTKIEALLETVGKTTQRPTIFLSPNDLSALQNLIREQGEKLGFAFDSNDQLVRGDVIIEVGSISIKDTATERAEALKSKKKIKSSKVSRKDSTATKNETASAENKDSNETDLGNKSK